MHPDFTRIRFLIRTRIINRASSSAPKNSSKRAIQTSKYNAIMSILPALIRKEQIGVLLLILALISTACAPGAQIPATSADGGPAGRLIIYSGRSEPLIQPVIAAFSERHPEVEVLLRAGSNSEMANALLEERGNPQADIFITTELFTIQALTAEGVFQSYRPAAAESLPVGAVGPQDSWVAVTRRARVIMYNTELVSPEEAPRSIFELADPKWRGQVAAAGSTNGSMQAQVAAMRQLIGEQETEKWLLGLRDNEVTFFGGHTDVRKAVGLGEFKVGLVNHYYYYLQLEEGSPVGIVIPDQQEDQIGLITNFTAAGIVNGSRNLAAAQAFIDFLLSPEGQELFAELNYEYPILPGTSLHPLVEPLDSYRLAEVDPAEAARNLNETFDLFERVNIP
jgi:iron(III) transport system substrate-binding protein